MRPESGWRGARFLSRALYHGAELAVSAEEPTNKAVGDGTHRDLMELTRLRGHLILGLDAMEEGAHVGRPSKYPPEFRRDVARDVAKDQDRCGRGRSAWRC